MSFAGKWTQAEMVILLEISQTQADIFVDLRLQKATDVDMKAWVTLERSGRGRRGG